MRGKEKIKEIMDEGMRSQALYRSGAPKLAIFRSLLKLVPVLLVILTILGLLVR
jgi:hypothetical protein